MGQRKLPRPPPPRRRNRAPPARRRLRVPSPSPPRSRHRPHASPPLRLISSSQLLDVLDQRHPEEIRDLAGTLISVSLVQSHRAPPTLRRIETPPRTLPLAQLLLHVLQQLPRDTRSRPLRPHRHASN